MLTSRRRILPLCGLVRLAVATLASPTRASAERTSASPVIPGFLSGKHGMNGRSRLIAGAFVAIVLASLNAACWSSLPKPDSDVYKQMVSAFFQGLAALQAGDDARAKDELTKATQIVADEPAGWADLGLLSVRQRDYDAATTQLAKALELAPKSAAIESMLGLLESSRGDSAKAIEHYTKAADLDPHDLKALYALAAETERQGAEGGDDKAQGIYDKILAERPKNVAVLLDSARIAARRGDKVALDKALAAIGADRTGWPAEAATQYDALVAAAAGPDVKTAGNRVAFLRNVLVRMPIYHSGLLEVKTPSTTVGEPITRFLALENPSPEPAAPDQTTAFTVDTAIAGPATWAAAVSVGDAVEGDGSAHAVEGDGSAHAVEGDGSVHTRPLVAALVGGELVVGNARVALGLDTSAATAHAVAFADLDYDFDLDAVVATAGGLRVVEQRSATDFADVTATAKIPQDLVSGRLAGVWAADVDLDGDLDLVVGRESAPVAVLVNNGDKTFAASDVFGNVNGVTDFAWVDVDDDGDPDAVFVAGGTLRVLRNERGGLFVEQKVGQHSVTSLAVGDLDGDGAVDVACAATDGSVLLVSANPDGAIVTRQLAGVSTSGSTAPSLVVADLDNNGALDLIVAADAGSRVFLGGANGSFSSLAPSVDGRVEGVADLNGDGKPDLVTLGPGGAVRRAINRGTASYHWQDIRPRAKETTGDQRINSFGIGASMEVRSGLLFQRQYVEGPVVHFGLGTNAATEVMRVVWPNGVVQAEFGLSSDQAALAEQRLKGSCPWLFAWNGSEMAFVTDFIWRSPLGLRINAQATAGVMQTEDWVRIRADQLAARDGFYDLRITADLWETHFFDYLKLVAIDHPADVDAFVDERFAVPPPRHEIIVTSHPTPVLAARDDRGEDVTDVVARRDGTYLDTFGRGPYQGVTRDHYVEVDLPDEVPFRGAVLLASGWIHPTDSSINVAISQGSSPAPTGLSLEAQDPDGRWRTLRSGLGFPEGKNKTIVLDLDGAIRRNAPRRLRLRTNLEIYWDSLAWAVRRPDVSIARHDLTAGVADLRFRGFSSVAQADPSSPELPDYGTISGTTQRWRDLVGYYTRFGDVRELVSRVDDRYIIMNAGDEIVLRFASPGAPPNGWVRDFVLVGDGWVKDGDLNTTFSKTVLPLPSHGDATYDRRPGELEEDPVYKRHAEDWREYHTRFVTPSGFASALREGGSR